MTTTKELDSVRAMSLEDQVIALAMPIVTDRIQRLEAQDRDALFSLLMELVNTPNLQRADIQGICETVLEILEARPGTISEFDFSAQAASPEAVVKWAVFVGGRIKAAREEACLTQDQLAERTGLPQSHISRIENAKLSPSRVTIEKIAAALGKNVADFDHAAERD